MRDFPLRVLDYKENSKPFTITVSKISPENSRLN